MATIRPLDLPAAASVSTTDVLIVDKGSAVERATPAQVVDAAIPLASQAEAETGTDNEKRVTPLRVKQAIDALGVSPTALAATGAGEGSSLVGFKQDGVGAVDRTAEAKLRDIVSVKDFGAAGDGTTDDTAAIQACIDASPAAEIFFPRGRYKVTASLIVTVQGTAFVGAGKRASRIIFAPTGNDTCIEFGDYSENMHACGVADMAIVSNDITHAKVALHLKDCSDFVLNNVWIGSESASNGLSNNWQGGTGGSIAIKTNGRDNTTFSNSNIQAQRPLVIGPNPNGSIAADHYVFANLYIIGSLGTGDWADDYPLVEIEDSPMGVVSGAFPHANGNFAYYAGVTNFTVTGRQAWVGGGYGLYWNDTTSTGVSQNVLIENVRREQAHVLTKHAFYVNRTNAYLHGLTFRNVYCGENNGVAYPGIFARRIQRSLELDGYSYSGTDAAVPALDIDATVENTTGVSCFVNAGALVNIAGQRKISWGAAYPSSNLPTDFTLQSTSAVVGAVQSEYWKKGRTVAINNGSTYTFAAVNAVGAILISTDYGANALFLLNASGPNTTEVADSAGHFTNAFGTASNINVAVNAGNFVIQNNIGYNVTLNIVSFGPGESGFAT